MFAHHLLAIWLVVVFTVHSAVAGTPRETAYVLLSGEVVAIDLKRGRLLKRLDFTDHIRPGEHACFDGRDPIVIGGSDRSRYGGKARVDLRRMKVVDFMALPPGRDRFEFLMHRDETTIPVPPAGVKIVQRRPKSEGQSGLRLVVHRAHMKDVELVIDPHPKTAPYETLDRWTVTPDGRRIVILTSSGFKYQSYLHVYDYASLRKMSITPVMKIRDHVPLGLFVL